jgi:hypothetical protein
MLVLAGLAVAFGWLRQDEGSRVNLQPWLILEVIGGAGASVLGGAVSWRIARRYRGPAVLALLVFSVGALEATEIFRHTTSGTAAAPRWLILLAPVVATAGVLFGGWLAAKASSKKAAQQPAAAAGGRQVRD